MRASIIKDLPDCEGVWWPASRSRPVWVIKFNGQWHYWDDRVAEYSVLSDFGTSRWVYIEKPDFTKK